MDQGFTLGTLLLAKSTSKRSSGQVALLLQARRVKLFVTERKLDSVPWTEIISASPKGETIKVNAERFNVLICVCL